MVELDGGDFLYDLGKEVRFGDLNEREIDYLEGAYLLVCS